jgi:glycine cleavage system H protein
MSRDEQSLQYTAEHEWVELADDLATVGVTAYAAEQLGDIVFIQLPEVGDEVAAGGSVGELESTKSVGDLFSPVSGTVEAVNEALADHPELVNSDPLGEGWLLKVRTTDVPDLLDLDAYRALTEQR